MITTSPTVAELPADWLTAMMIVAKHYRLNVSTEKVRIDLNWSRHQNHDAYLFELAKQLGLNLVIQPFQLKALDPWRLPLIIEFTDGLIGVIHKIEKKGNINIALMDDQGLTIDLSPEDLKQRAKRILVLRPNSMVADARVDAYIKPYKANWFWTIILKDKKHYFDLILASLLANILTLSTTLFSMQIYDRVVPAQSIPTLWVLFTGVFIALSFEFLLRIARAKLTDNIGKRADASITDIVFGHALRLKTEARSQSTGSFIAQIRELEQIRELITSTTLNAILDIPFILVFLIILWFIGGSLVFVPIVTIPLLLIAGIIAQYPLGKLSQQGMRESALRNAMLVEAVESLEDIKLLRAEQRFQNQWNQINEVSAEISKKQRAITTFLTSWTQSLQSLTFVCVLVAGAYLVMDGTLTTGALVGASILSSRMIAPLAQWTGVFTRLQQAKVAYKGLNELMKRPVDQPEEKALLQRPVLHGHFQLDRVQYFYQPENPKPALEIHQLEIHPGDRIAILGRMGAGKSTLLQLLAGIISPTEGSIRLDHDVLNTIDTADIRRDIGYLTQNARLFHGSIRENLTMGRPQANDKEILQALHLCSALETVRTLNGGLDYMIQEGGVGLSGGQRQAILLTRVLLCQPQILLLDEPTASLDESTERQIVKNLHTWLGHRTLIIATHRPAVLEWVNKLMVVDGGKIVSFGDKASVLRQLSNPIKK